MYTGMYIYLQILTSNEGYMSQVAAISRIAERKFHIAQKTKSKKLRLAYRSHECAVNLIQRLNDDQYYYK